MMRNLYLAITILIISFASLSSVQADGNARQSRGYSARGYQSGSQARTYRTWRGGFFDRLLEMERRKNEMLFGRFRR